MTDPEIPICGEECIHEEIVEKVDQELPCDEILLSLIHI